eukprot:14809643-Heterocapsa_arctica.AAC.1
MAATRLGGPGLDKVWARRPRGRRSGTRGGGRDPRREREADPEGEDLSRGKFSNRQATHKVEQKDNSWEDRQDEHTAKCSNN